MSAVKAEPEHSCWTAEYLRAHCEGYRVESDEGKLGYVEEVVWASDGSEPLALRVRTGFGEHVTLVLEDVLDLDPSFERIVVRAWAGRAEPPGTYGSPARPKERAQITKRESRSALRLSAR